MCEINDKKVTENILFPGIGACGCIKPLPMGNIAIVGTPSKVDSLLYTMIAKIVEYTNPDKVRIWFHSCKEENDNPFDMNPNRMCPHVERTSLQCREIGATLDEWTTLGYDKAHEECDDDQTHILVFDGLYEVESEDIKGLVEGFVNLADYKKGKCFVILPVATENDVKGIPNLDYVTSICGDDITVTTANGRESKYKAWNYSRNIINKIAKVFGVPRHISARYCRVSPYGGSLVQTALRLRAANDRVNNYQE